MSIISKGILHMSVGEMKKLAAELSLVDLESAHAEMKAYTPSNRRMAHAQDAAEVILRLTREDRGV